MLACGTMPRTSDAFRFFLFAVAGWMNQDQQCTIAYFRKEDRILRAHPGAGGLRFTHEQGRSLPAKAPDA